jgi:GntR family transcriptional regulator, transcriptional repressor for pyruvate dehydrogenase complex
MGLTDEAIAGIKERIIAGEFGPREKLPKEADLASMLGLSRSSLREAVRALSHVGVLETRQGDGTYVTSLTPDELLAGMSHVSDLVSGVTILELHQIRRLLEPAATAAAADRLTQADLASLASSVDDMTAAATMEEFIQNDQCFHRTIVDASGNATLASLIKQLSGRTQRAHVWRAAEEHGATERTIRMHQEILAALRARDSERARAAALLHLHDAELWLGQHPGEGDP